MWKFSQASRTEVGKKLEGDTAGTAHLIWQTGYSIPCNITLKNNVMLNWGRGRSGWGGWASKVAIAQRLRGHCLFYGRWRVIAFASFGYFLLSLTLLNCPCLNPQVFLPWPFLFSPLSCWGGGVGRSKWPCGCSAAGCDQPIGEHRCPLSPYTLY